MSEVAAAEDGHARRQWPSAMRAGAIAAHWIARVAISMVRRFRRRRLIIGLAFQAVWGRARVDHEIATDFILGRHVKFVVTPRTRNSIVIGPRCMIRDDVLVNIYGGQLELGEQVEIRPRCVFHLGGNLRFAGKNIMSYGSTVHCDEHVEIGPMTLIGEYVTITDSSHTHQGEDWFVANIKTAPVAIGARVFLGAKCTVARGVRVGDRSVAGANSLVTSDVPADCLAAGVPAQIIRRTEDGAVVDGAADQALEPDVTSSS